MAVVVGSHHGSRSPDDGWRQACAAADLLASEQITRLVASPTRRAQETASPLAKRFGLPIDMMEGWAEADRRASRYRSTETLRVEGGEAWARFLRDPIRYPGADPETFRSGVLATLRAMAAQEAKSARVVVYSLDIETIRMASRDIATITSRCDAVLLPTLPQGTRSLGFYDMSLHIGPYNKTCMGEDNVDMAPFSISGQPAIALPPAESAGGLPIGVRVIGRPADESTLFRLAGQLEIARPWAHRRPKVHAAHATG